MPPRWLSVGIVASWLATMGWLFWHDLWPRWRPGEPPPFSIDPVDEVRHGDRLPQTHWHVQRQKKDEAKPVDLFNAFTGVDYRQEDDTFAFHAELKAKGQEHLKLSYFRVSSMTSEYRVNRGGQLLAFRVQVNLSEAEQKSTSKDPIRLEIVGEMRDNQLYTHCQGSSESVSQLIKVDLPPVAVSHNASVLLPLHPVDRIRGLRPGQSWRQPLIDPLRDALGIGGVRYLNARVLPQPQVLKEDKNDKMTCLVIEYKDEDGRDAGRTWVEQDSERVQQQEAVLDGDRWIMKRENLRKATKGTPRFPPGR